MKIEKLHIRNFRGIEDLSMELIPSDTVALIGINEAGKTSVSDCIAMLLAQFIARLTGKNDRETAFPLTDDDINVNSSATQNRITITDGTTRCFWMMASNQPHSVSVKMKSDCVQLAQYVSHLHDKLAHAPDSALPIVAYYHTHRDFLNKSSESGQAIQLGTQKKYASAQFYAYENVLQTGGSNFHEFATWFRLEEDWEYQSKVEKKDLNFVSRSLEVVRNALQTFFSRLSPGHAPILRVKRIKRDGTFTYNQYRLQHDSELIVTHHNQELKVSQLSDGLKLLVLMVGDMAHRLAIANPATAPLQGKGIVLIDEIELHLHPRWQREILPSLRETFPNIQFIVTTHSPQVLSAIRRENIYIISEGKIQRPSGDSFGRDSGLILEEIMSDQKSPIAEMAKQYFRLIERDRYESIEAAELRKEMERKTTSQNPVLIQADAFVRRKRMLGR